MGPRQHRSAFDDHTGAAPRGRTTDPAPAGANRLTRRRTANGRTREADRQEHDRRLAVALRAARQLGADDPEMVASQAVEVLANAITAGRVTKGADQFLVGAVRKLTARDRDRARRMVPVGEITDGTTSPADAIVAAIDARAGVTDPAPMRLPPGVDLDGFRVGAEAALARPRGVEWERDRAAWDALLAAIDAAEARATEAPGSMLAIAVDRLRPVVATLREEVAPWYRARVPQSATREQAVAEMAAWTAERLGRYPTPAELARLGLASGFLRADPGTTTARNVRHWSKLIGKVYGAERSATFAATMAPALALLERLDPAGRRPR